MFYFVIFLGRGIFFYGLYCIFQLLLVCIVKELLSILMLLLDVNIVEQRQKRFRSLKSYCLINICYIISVNVLKVFEDSVMGIGGNIGFIILVLSVIDYVIMREFKVLVYFLKQYIDCVFYIAYQIICGIKCLVQYLVQSGY